MGDAAMKNARRSAGGNSDRLAPISRKLTSPVFAQPEPTPDPTVFKVKHPSDGPAYKAIDALNAAHDLKAMTFPAPRGRGPEPQLTLATVFGNGTKAVDAIQQQGQIVFHAG